MASWVLWFCAIVTALNYAEGHPFTVTCSLSRIRECVENYQNVIRKHSYKGIQDKLRDGCTQFKAYVACLGKEYTCNATKHNVLVIRNTSYVSNGDFLQVGTLDLGSDRNATNNSSQKQIDLSLSKHHSSKTNSNSSDTKNHLLKRWQFGIMQTSIIYDKLGLCNDINVKALKNKTHEISQNKTDLAKHTDTKCFKLFPCFANEMDGIKKSTNYCALLDSFIDCVHKNKCDVKMLNDYAAELNKGFKQIVQKLKKIPHFCDSLTT